MAYSVTSTSNMRPLRLPDEGKSVGRNDVRTDALRRALLAHLSYGSEPYLARTSGVCISSVRHQAEGEQRLSAPLLRSMLLLASPEETAELVSMWLGVPMRFEP